MEKITRKHCSAISRTRARMPPTKAKQQNQHKGDLQCRHCSQQLENQEHLLTECPALQGNTPLKMYDEDLNRLRSLATHIMATERKGEETKQSQQSSDRRPRLRRTTNTAQAQQVRHKNTNCYQTGKPPNGHTMRCHYDVTKKKIREKNGAG